MSIYIQGMGNVSPQETFDNQSFLTDIRVYKQEFLTVIEPDYKTLLPARARRRMSKNIKIGVTAAKQSLSDAGIEKPEAIIVGTGMGCLGDSQKFVISMIKDKEQFLTPTRFIQSTHNTVGATIALLLKCYDYNFTYAHRGFSFENALLDGMMQLAEGDENQVLVGAVDEMTSYFHSIEQPMGYWKKQATSNLKLLDYQSIGALPGEGSTFFVLGREKTTGSYAKIVDIHTIYKPEEQAIIEQELKKFLTKNDLRIQDLDLVVLGLSGDQKMDSIYHYLQQTIFDQQIQTWYKHLSGEYHTDTAFALWLAAKIIHHQEVPKAVRLNEAKRDTIKNVLIYRHFRDINHSFLLVQGVN